MMGPLAARDGKLFHVGFNLDDRVPADHPLRRIDRVIDFSFVRPMVAALYGHNGHVSLDPTLLLRLLFLCFFENVRSERELMRQLPMRLDWLWFCRLDLDSDIPDHSVLCKARRRWGERTFERVFARVVRCCQEAGLIEGKTVHADSTLLRASASLEGRVSRVLWEQLERASLPAEQATPAASSVDQEEQPKGGDDQSGGSGAANDSTDATANSTPNPTVNQSSNESSTPHRNEHRSERRGERLNDRLVSPVDPDAATATRRAGGTTLGYRDHRLIDDRCGIILASVATPADRDDGSMLEELLMRQRDYNDSSPKEVVGDSMYGTRDNYALLKREGVKAYLKKRRGKDSPRVSWLKLLPADCSPARALKLLARRKSRAEGSFAQAHVRMNHRRCRWRRRWSVQIQCYLVATVQNLQKLARHCCRALESRLPRGRQILEALPAQLMQQNDNGSLKITCGAI